MTTWYAIHAKAQRETDACLNLKRQGYGVFFPRRWVTFKRRGRYGAHTVTELRPFFPRYLFAAVDRGQSVHAINSTVGVSTVIYFAGEAVTLTDGDLWQMRKDFDPDGVLPPGVRSVKHMRKVWLSKLAGLMPGVEWPDLGSDLTGIDDRGRFRLSKHHASFEVAAVADSVQVITESRKRFISPGATMAITGAVAGQAGASIT